MRFDREVYFDKVRGSLFQGALSQQQVDGQNVILGLWEGDQTGTPMDDVRWLSYMLASVYHETMQTMWAIEEIGRGEGKPYGEPDPQTGNVFYGRGLIQLTWKENYAKASSALGLIDNRDLVWNPNIALDSLIAARIMCRGMAEGWFTGRKLGQYFSETEDDPVGAREIVNGHDCDEMIAGYHDEFLEALEAAKVGRE